MIKFTFLPVTVGDALERNQLTVKELTNFDRLKEVLSLRDYRKCEYLNSQYVVGSPDMSKVLNCLSLNFLEEYLGLNILQPSVECIQPNFLAALLRTGEDEMCASLMKHLHMFVLPFDFYRVSQKEYVVVFSEMKELGGSARPDWQAKCMENILEVVADDVPSPQLLKEPIYVNYLNHSSS